MALHVPAKLDPVAALRPRIARRQGGKLREVVAQWWSEQGLAAHPASVGKRVALALVEHPRIVDKLAGIAVLEHHLADHLRTADLASFAALFDSDALDDARIVDPFAVGVLGTLLHRVRGRGEATRALAQWRQSRNKWQRRAACVAFTTLAPQGDRALPGLGQLIFTLCSTVVWSLDPADQSAVAWLLFELSRAEPTRVEGFVRRHARFMTLECARHCVANLPVTRQQDILAHWQRATTPRRRSVRK